jgi:putative transposase
VLKGVAEALDQKYKLKSEGYDFARAIERVARVRGIRADQLTALDKSSQTVQARSLLCFWAHRKLGMSTIGISNILRRSQPAVSRSSKRGKNIEKEGGFEFIEY